VVSALARGMGAGGVCARVEATGMPEAGTVFVVCAGTAGGLKEARRF
jgi:hypothetical protein